LFFSELNIVGFKSFAKKTQILLRGGITCVVGPNGCGKSNIVDAIRWVMGEQRSGMLRSDRMENVIFNGSASAKPVGMAEVSVVIENSKRRLPLDYGEVTIARRLFRSGESQYMINGAQCRLKDILDLLMDTGLGVNIYSVIELSQVEKILNGKPEERRRIFEEAAGITKYKLRRKATFRKLEATEKDLVRVEDIMSEVEKSVRSLRRQVSRAQRYQKLSSELRELEIELATHDYSAMMSELKPLEEMMSRVTDEREKTAASLRLEEAEYETLRGQLLQMNQKLTELQGELNARHQEIRKLDETLLINSERIRHLRESRKRFETERKRLSSNLEQLERERLELGNRIQTQEKSLKDARETFEKHQTAHEQLRTRVEQRRSSLKSADAEILRITEALSRKQNEGERLRANEENLAGRLKQLEREESEAAERLSVTRDQIKSKEAKLQQLSGELDEKRERHESLTRKSAEAGRAISSLKTAELADQNRIEVYEHEAGLLRRLLENYEDYPSGVRFLARHKEYPSVGTVANLFKVESQYRTAIAAALGEAATSLVVQNRERAHSGIGLLRSEKKGVVTFLPVSGISRSADGRPPLQDLGVVGWAVDLITCPQDHLPLAEMLLGDYLVVGDRETAERLFEQIRAMKANLVTLTGEVYGYSGWLRGGRRGPKDTDFIGRQEKLSELEDSIEKLGSTIKQRRRKMAQYEQESTAAFRQIEQLETEIERLDEQRSSARVDMGRLNYEESALIESEKKRAAEKRALIEQVDLMMSNIEAQRCDASDLQNQRKTLSDQSVTLGRELTELERALNEAAANLGEAREALVRVQSENEALLRERKAADSRIAEVKKEITSSENESEEAEREIERRQGEEISLGKRKSELQDDVEVRENDLNLLKEQHFSTNTRADERERSIREIRRENDTLAERVHATEMKVSELRLKAQNLRTRMAEEYEHKLTAAPVDPDLDVETIGARVLELRGRVKEIGPVNLLALKEFEGEKERLDFLKTQREDLIAARRNLMNTIDLINVTAREKFLETFEKAQKNFAEVFKTFFDGGRASLVLRDDGDPLENDIEIYATPAGKKLSSLQLLSGGEKALTAISLLFAIYLVKPSPFCIFDEVDAPLDDQNIERFTRALNEFSANTQFIVVTHNKLTMRAAQQMYGITMEQEGISKVVSVTFEDGERTHLDAARAQ